MKKTIVFSALFLLSQLGIAGQHTGVGGNPGPSPQGPVPNPPPTIVVGTIFPGGVIIVPLDSNWQDAE